MPHVWHWGGFSTEVQRGWSAQRGTGSVHIPAVPLSQIIPVLLELGKQEWKGGPCSSVLPGRHCPSLNWGAPATPALGSFLITPQSVIWGKEFQGHRDVNQESALGTSL